MFDPASSASIFLAAILAFAAVRKLSHQTQVVQSYVRLGVPEAKLNALALLLLAGAAGLIIGLWWPVIGIAAAIGVLLYFLGAIIVHIRANDAKHLATPLGIALIAAVVLVLNLVA